MDFSRCQLPCSRLIVSKDQHGKCVRCVGLVHAWDAIFGFSNCKYCENFTLKTLRTRLVVFDWESAVLPRRAASEASFLHEAAAWSSEAELEAMESEQFSLSLPPSPERLHANSSGPVFSLLSCTQPGGTGHCFLRVGGYFIYRVLQLWGLRGRVLRPILNLCKF